MYQAQTSYTSQDTQSKSPLATSGFIPATGNAQTTYGTSNYGSTVTYTVETTKYGTSSGVQGGTAGGYGSTSGTYGTAGGATDTAGAYGTSSGLQGIPGGYGSTSGTYGTAGATGTAGGYGTSSGLQGTAGGYGSTSGTYGTAGATETTGGYGATAGTYGTSQSGTGHGSYSVGGLQDVPETGYTGTTGTGVDAAHAETAGTGPTGASYNYSYTTPVTSTTPGVSYTQQYTTSYSTTYNPLSASGSYQTGGAVPTTSYTTTTNYGATDTTEAVKRSGTYGATDATEAVKRSGTYGTAASGTYADAIRKSGTYGTAAAGSTSATYGGAYGAAAGSTSGTYGAAAGSASGTYGAYSTQTTQAAQPSYTVRDPSTYTSTTYTIQNTTEYQSPVKSGYVDTKTSGVGQRQVQSLPVRPQTERTSMLSPYRNTMYPEFELVEDLPDRKNLIDSINILLQKSPQRESLLTSPSRVSIKRQSMLSPAEIEVACLLKEKYEDGSLYEGEARNGLRHGKGRITFRDGRIFEGQFADGRAEGNGVFTYKTGKVLYQGGVSNTLYEGQGTLQCEAPTPLQEFNPQDFGKLGNSWTRYEGEFRGGKKHGNGTLHLTSGEKYVGEFRDDQVHGKGAFHLRDGRVVQGNWSNNVLTGNF